MNKKNKRDEDDSPESSFDENDLILNEEEKQKEALEKEKLEKEKEDAKKLELKKLEKPFIPLPKLGAIPVNPRFNQSTTGSNLLKLRNPDLQVLSTISNQKKNFKPNIPVHIKKEPKPPVEIKKENETEEKTQQEKEKQEKSKKEVKKENKNSKNKKIVSTQVGFAPTANKSHRGNTNSKNTIASDENDTDNKKKR